MCQNIVSFLWKKKLKRQNALPFWRWKFWKKHNKVVPFMKTKWLKRPAQNESPVKEDMSLNLRLCVFQFFGDTFIHPRVLDPLRVSRQSWAYTFMILIQWVISNTFVNEYIFTLATMLRRKIHYDDYTAAVHQVPPLNLSLGVQLNEA